MEDYTEHGFSRVRIARCEKHVNNLPFSKWRSAL
jgi:hypothetical protein